MKAFLHNHPQDVTEQELERDLAMVPEWRRVKALAYKFHSDRVLSVKAYLLLREALREVWGIDDDSEWVYNEHEKPSLKNHPEVHFNLSHCKTGVLCVVDDCPVGCDIERIVKTVKTDLCKYCMNEQEVAQIMDAPNPCVEFTRLWTMKEAVVKLTGQGLTTSLHDILSNAAVKDINIETIVDLDLGYCYSIATLK
ncbi:MAG: 4'-phosphopantetheinyl transferase superfamily protein [Bacteroidales bacterium]|nr:4'-phosphopantetheinyl transferase superfamily protein [Candidatus Sodaliphilus fimicaballi]